MKLGLLFIFSVLFFPPLVFAQDEAGAALSVKAAQAFMMDAETGAVLLAKNADERMPTSSMSKIMTMYLVFEAIRDGKLKLDEELKTSEKAWSQEGSRMFLKVGQGAKVEDLIRGVIVQSGNDAAVVLAEAIGGTEENFAAMMNAKAAEFGMTESHFVNATGLPDEKHYSTARDLAKLALAMLRDFLQHYHYFSEKEFAFNGIKQGNRNPLLYRNMDVDGIKTGHAEKAGFGITASAMRDGRRLVLVVNGLPSMQERADEAAMLLDWGYREFGLYSVLDKGEVLGEADVWLGKEKKVSFAAAGGSVLTLPRNLRDSLKVNIEYENPLRAPVAEGQKIGKAVVTASGIPDSAIDLVTTKNVERLDFACRVWEKIKFIFRKI